MKLMIPFDGSWHADNVLETVIAQPWPEKTTVYVVTVEPPLQVAPFLQSMAIEEHASLEEDVRKMVRAASDKLAEKFGKANVTTEIINDKDPGRIICEQAQSWNPDLIIMGAHGHSGVNDVRGSVVTKVLNNVGCSVQMLDWSSSESVQKKEREHISPLTESRILVAVDNTPNSRAIPAWLKSRPWPKGTHVQVLSVVEEPKSVFHSKFFKDPKIDDAHKQLYLQQKQTAESLVSEMANQLSETFGKDHVTHHVMEGHVRSLICQIAQDWGADLIVMGAHDRDKSVLEHFLGSVTRAVVDNAECSVEVVRA